MIKTEHLPDVANELVSFLETTLESKGLSSFVFYVSGGVDTSVVAALCARTKYPCFPVEIVGHRDSLFSGNKVFNVCYGLGLTNHLKTTIGVPFQRLIGEVRRRNEDQAIDSGLAAILRMAVLDRKAKIENGMIVAGLNRGEDRIVRPYHKRGQGSADVFPIADLYKSEIRQLGEYLGLARDVVYAESTIDIAGDSTKPTPELDDPWLTSNQLEWARIEMDEWATHHHGTDFEEVISSGRRFFSDSFDQKLMFPEHWTKDQKEMMEHVVKIEYQTRHKHNPNVPVCRISDNYREKHNGDIST